jgi:DNA-binding winged helix-turn-helix (wHTH) protein/TolB-like protein/cytochrome c-type biogenesis protein CcmH/NrfG
LEVVKQAICLCEDIVSLLYPNFRKKRTIVFDFSAMLTLNMKISRYAFSVFTFDAAIGVLKRNGHYIRVPPQTLILLKALLERAGAMVTREELRLLLWPEGEFIDHDHAINRAINFLRAVLRDNPKKPQYIETLPKRGYRFIAPVSSSIEDTELVGESPADLLAPAPAAAVYSEANVGVASQGADAISGEIVPSLPNAAALEQTSSETLSLYAEEFTPAAPPSAGFFARLMTSVKRAPTAYAISAAMALALACALIVSIHRKPVADGLTMGIVPFEVKGTEAEQLEGGLRADLTDTLSQLPSLQVHALHSLERVRSDDPGLMAIAKSLHLDLLLLGKLTVNGNQCVLQIDLLRSRDAMHLASYTYSGSLQDLATIRNKAQHDIFSGLQLIWDTRLGNAGSTENADAYIDYLRAHDLDSRPTVANLNSALAQFQAAIQHDPQFVRAYAGMATTYLNLARYNDPPENLREAKMFAEKAITLNPRVAEAYAVLGWVAMRRDWNTALGEAQLRRAVELEPNEASHHAVLAECLAYEGRSDEALREIDLARVDDPLWSQTNAMDIFVSGVARQYARGVEVAWHNVEQRPNSLAAHDLLAWSLFDAGRYEEAIREWREMAVLEKDDARVTLEDKGLAEFRRGGSMAYAAVRLGAIERNLDTARMHPNDFAAEEWYAYTGDHDHAIAALQQKIDRHDPSAINFAVNPMLDNLHNDPRFQAMLSRIGLSIPVVSEPSSSARASLNH